MENNNMNMNAVQPATATANIQPAAPQAAQNIMPRQVQNMPQQVQNMPRQVQNMPQQIQRPAGYPAGAAPVAAAAPAPVPDVSRQFDSEGRERTYMFIKKMNSVGNALLIDIGLQTVAVVQVVLIAVIVWMFSNMASLANLMSMTESIDGEMLEGLMLCAIIANGVALSLSHTLAGYMHSVRNGFTLGSVMGKARWRGSGFWGAIVLALGATYSWMFVCMILGWLMPDSIFAGNTFSTSSYEGAGTARMIATALYVCIGAPLTEEILCRGVLLKSMSKYGVPFAVFTSSFIFGIIHGNIYQSPFAFMVGLVLAYVAVRSGSIWPGVIIHFIVNAFATGRDLTMALVPAEYTDVVLYGFYGLAGVLVLGSIIILCTGAKRIKWQPIDAQTNRLLLPEVKSRVRCKPLVMLLAVSLLIVFIIYAYNIWLTSGASAVSVEELMESFNAN